MRLVVYPAFPGYEEFEDGISWAIHRKKGEGGGPSIFSAMALARELETFLNSPYSEEDIRKWHETIGVLESYPGRY